MEQDYKEKYEQVVEALQEILDSGQESIAMSRLKLRIYPHVPELKQMNDERIKKCIIDTLKGYHHLISTGGITKEDMIEWLQNQGSKSSEYSPYKATIESISELCDRYSNASDFLDFYNTVKVKCRVAMGYDNTPIKNQNWVEEDHTPRFYVDEWVVQENIGIYKIIEVCESWYEVVDENDKRHSIGFDQEFMCHLWSLNDANDGDILVTAVDGKPFIYKEGISASNPHAVLAYCGLDGEDSLIVNSQDNKFSWWDDTAVEPATNKQKEHLFEKIRSSGHLWNPYNKTLIEVD